MIYVNTEALIKIITQEVLKRVSMLSPQASKEKSKSILILDSSSNQNKTLYEAIILRWRDTKFIGDCGLDDGIEAFDYIIVPELSNKDLVNIAVGAPQGEICETIVDAILQGKSVIVLEDGISYRKFKSTANKNFFNMFKTYEEKILNFGVEILSSKDIVDHLEGRFSNKSMQNKAVEENKSNNQEKLETKQEAEINAKVLSERSIERLWFKGYKNICIDEKSIITPLAMDFIRINGINIIKK